MNKDEVLQKLDKKEIKLRELEKYFSPEESRQIRLEYIKKQTNLSLDQLDSFNLHAEKLHNKNIENLISSVEIPLGIVGPIQIDGEYTTGNHYIPLATTEGALLASISRGIKATNKNKITTIVDYNGMTRAPLFEMNSIKDLAKISDWLHNNFEKLDNLTNKTSNHISLVNYELHYLGKSLWIRFFFDTSEAMGMNMVTNASKTLANYIAENTPLKLVAISGNVCIDKKASMLHKISPRGFTVSAESVISKETVKKILKTTVKNIIKVNHEKTWLGSQMAGSLSNNAHTANIIAAIFTATGQDLAHIVDSSISDTVMSEDDGNLYVSIKINSLVIGSIGGGTGLDKQATNIKLLLTDINTKKINPDNPNFQFAENIAGTVLAGELSLHAAIASGNLTSAHKKLGQRK